LGRNEGSETGTSPRKQCDLQFGGRGRIRGGRALGWGKPESRGGEENTYPSIRNKRKGRCKGGGGKVAQRKIVGSSRKRFKGSQAVQKSQVRFNGRKKGRVRVNLKKRGNKGIKVLAGG